MHTTALSVKKIYSRWKNKKYQYLSDTWKMGKCSFLKKCLALCCDCLFGEYWFRISRYVYDGNRSFAPILRQSRWSLLYDVYWLKMMMLNTWTGTTGYFFCLTGNRQRVPEQVAGSKYLNMVQDQNCSFSLLNKINKDQWKWKQNKIIEQWTK